MGQDHDYTETAARFPQQDFIWTTVKYGWIWTNPLVKAADTPEKLTAKPLTILFIILVLAIGG